MSLSVGAPIPIGPMTLASDGVSNGVGLLSSLQVSVRQHGGTFRPVAGAISEVGNGFYEVAGNIADTGIPGTLYIYATASGCDAFNETAQISEPRTDDGTALGRLIELQIQTNILLAKLLNRGY